MAAIIKAGNVHSSAEASQSVAFNLEDLTQHAQSYLDKVREQARQILAEAKQEAEKIKQQASQEGQQAAWEDAQRQLEAKLDERVASLLPALQQAAEAIRTSQQDWLQHWEKETIGLAAAIARRIVRRELSQQPEITVELIREALQLALGGGRVRLHLHPDDHQLLGTRVDKLRAALGSFAPAEVVADPETERGGCRVFTEFGVVDQTLDGQLQRIEEELC